MFNIITNKQREFLEKLKSGEITKEDNPKRYNELMVAIREQIDARLGNTLWLVDNYLDILRDDKAEIEDENLERYRRFKAFAYITHKLDPDTELQDIDLKEALKKLSQLYPKFYFEAIRKKYEDDEEL